MNVLLTKSEAHPVEDTVFPKAEEDKDALFVFGIHRLRGDNKIYLSESTPSVVTFLNGKGLGLIDQAQGDNFARAQGTATVLREMGYQHIILVGVSYNVRKTWTDAQYIELIGGIKTALEH